MKNKIFKFVCCIMLLATFAFAGETNLDSLTVTPTDLDTYSLRGNNTSGTRVFSVNSSGNTYAAGTLDVTGAVGVTGVLTAPSAVLVTPTITTPTMTFGYTSYAYTSGSGATYAVSATGTVPHAYRITGGSGTTTFVMTYGGTAASNAGKIFYIINSSSNTVTFKSSGATGISVATLKIMTVVGNGTDFERITADQ